MLHINRQTVYKWVRAGRLPAPIRTTGQQGRMLWWESTILEWIDHGMPSQ